MNRKPFFAYRSFQKEFDAMREFHAAGVNQFCVFPAHTTNSLGEPYSEYPPTWLAPEVYDFAPFDQQIEDAMVFVKKHINLGSRIADVYREDIYALPLDSARELLSNPQAG